MTTVDNNPWWNKLKQSQIKIQQKPMQELFQEDPQRFEKFSRSACGLFLDFSKNNIDTVVFEQLVKLAENIEQLFVGGEINNSERRPALHTALRRPAAEALLLQNKDIMQEIDKVRCKIENFVNKIQPLRT